VPFNGSGQIYQALLGGQLPLAYVTLESALPHVRRGRLKVLGVTNATRSAPFAAFAPIAETVPGFEVIGFFGFMAPAQAPQAAVAALSDAIASVLVSPAWTSRANDLAVVVNVGAPPVFAAFLRQEITRYRALTLQAGIKLD
jgi:tripartite-type tricarboxylate transporter receptor subunit TctC